MRNDDPEERPRFYPEIIAYDRDDRPIAWATVRASTVEDRIIALLWESLRAETAGDDRWKYLILADYAWIRIVRADEADDPSKLVRLPTAEILSPYEPNVGEMIRDRAIYRDYFRALIAAWLRDVAYHWRGEEPPGLAAMQEIGLAAAIADGTTRDEVELASHPLY